MSNMTDRLDPFDTLTVRRESLLMQVIKEGTNLSIIDFFLYNKPMTYVILDFRMQ